MSTSHSEREEGRLPLLLFVAAGVDLAAFSAIVPLLPRYSERLGLSNFEVGIVIAAYAVAVLVVSIPAGRAADRWGKKSWTVLGVAGMAVATVLFGFASSFATLVAARILQGCASGIAWSAGMAWLAEAAPPERRAGALAKMTAGASTGLIAGPMIGGVLGHVIGIKSAFLVIAAICGATTVGLLSESEGAGVTRPPISVLDGVLDGVRDRLIRLGLVLVSAVALANAGLQTLVPLHLGREGMSAFGIGIVYAVAAGASASIGLFVDRITARVDLTLAAVAATAALMMIAAVLALPLSVALICAVTIIEGSVQTLILVAGFALSAEGAAHSGLGHGMVMGVVNLGWGAAAFAGPMLAGGISAATADPVAYLVLAVVIAGALAALLVWRQPEVVALA